MFSAWVICYSGKALAAAPTHNGWFAYMCGVHRRLIQPIVWCTLKPDTRKTTTSDIVSLNSKLFTVTLEELNRGLLGLHENAIKLSSVYLDT